MVDFLDGGSGCQYGTLLEVLAWDSFLSKTRVTPQQCSGDDNLYLGLDLWSPKLGCAQHHHHHHREKVGGSYTGLSGDQVGELFIMMIMYNCFLSLFPGVFSF